MVIYCLRVRHSHFNNLFTDTHNYTRSRPPSRISGIPTGDEGILAGDVRASPRNKLALRSGRTTIIYYVRLSAVLVRLFSLRSSTLLWDVYPHVGLVGTYTTLCILTYAPLYPRPSDSPRRRSYTHVVRPRITWLKYLFVLWWMSAKLWITKIIMRSLKCNNIM